MGVFIQVHRGSVITAQTRESVSVFAPLRLEVTEAF